MVCLFLGLQVEKTRKFYPTDNRQSEQFEKQAAIFQSAANPSARTWQHPCLQLFAILDHCSLVENNLPSIAGVPPDRRSARSASFFGARVLNEILDKRVG